MNVLLKTSMGDIKIQLDFDKAPKSAANFQQYVEDGYFNGLIFHRVINGFMVQGGGFEPGMTQRASGAAIKNEANNGVKNTKYSLAMARTMDPHSATGQFFINVADNSFLDFKSETADGWGYAVFGEVIDGTEVVDRIKAVPTTSKAGHQDVPTDDVIIESATMVD
ncbi:MULTISPECIES: peptidylprolyl isomerase [Reinekea]|uniref:peptidylprolyl isomerase n=1 Tax=Reinekea TaxID=230494 RepID=UPI0023530155|nr:MULTISPECIES: peptidylprolyl isomerase [Reinekea]MDO7642613.1 peptidylprolyl isomerase [Reinekea forsetii]